ncbi:MAG: hypothetical protein J0H94_08410 [Rhizobiales bacterium]|nr:hypothetical protein [Hyphomicrobiales bacterium]
MIAFIARFAGLWLIAGALVALVVDGTKTIAGSALAITSFRQTWTTLSPATLEAAEAFIHDKVESHVGHWIWDPAIQWVIALPTWVVLGAIGGWLAYMGRKRRVSPAFA